MGSSNLTDGGLRSNREATIRLHNSDDLDAIVELRALFAEFLRAIRVVPDAGLLELASYFLKALVLAVVIKDTPSRSRCDPRDL